MLRLSIRHVAEKASAKNVAQVLLQLDKFGGDLKVATTVHKHSDIQMDTVHNLAERSSEFRVYSAMSSIEQGVTA